MSIRVRQSRYIALPIDHSTRLPLTTWDRETLRAVAVAYRRVRRLGERDLPARNAAEAVYQERHPNVPAMDAQQVVSLMISVIAREHPKWLWSGVGAAKPLSASHARWVIPRYFVCPTLPSFSTFTGSILPSFIATAV